MHRIRTVGLLDADHAADRHHLAARVARAQPADALGIAAEGASACAITCQVRPNG
jgi:hypothetical protein